MSLMPQVPWSTEEELRILCGYKCNVDAMDNIQIHHIDGDNTNSDPDNWVVLCINCHDRAQRDLQTTGTTMSLKLTPDRLRSCRKFSIEAHLSRRIGSLAITGESEHIPETTRVFIRNPNALLVDNAINWLRSR